MCGISGFTGATSTNDIQAMMNSIVHRGPDDQGFIELHQCSLGMRRLSIVDLEQGQQPVANDNKSIHAVFNGEIYNHKELRSNLEKEGVKFRSHHSDSEVIPHLYEKYGPDFLKHLNGMFAIALWDETKEHLLLARDHSGIKPLYYTIVDNNLIFGSEIKAILAHSGYQAKPNFIALHHYFSLKNIPAPMTAFLGVQQLLPGEQLIWKAGRLSKQKWWQINFDQKNDFSEDEAAKEVRRLLEKSVEMQIQCDVNFGAYLSGGIDSSAVVALMSRMMDRPVKTFTLGYKDKISHKQADEIAANRVSEMYKTDHHKYEMGKEEILNSVDEVVAAFDQPFSGVTSTYFLTKLISKHVKVALSGDGADELFGSYLPHRLAHALQAMDEVDGDLNAIDNIEKFDLNKDYLLSVWKEPNETARRMRQYISTDVDKAQLYSQNMKLRVEGILTSGLIEEHYNKMNITDPLNRALCLDFQTLLPDQVLDFVDKLSMAHSVEVRPPFLDPNLIEFVATLPGHFKIKNGRVKHILKQAISDLLPMDIIDRPKEGFVLPINHWGGPLIVEKIRHALSPEKLALHDIFDAEKITEKIKKLAEGDTGQISTLWNIYIFQVWWEKYFA